MIENTHSYLAVFSQGNKDPSLYPPHQFPVCVCVWQGERRFPPYPLPSLKLMDCLSTGLVSTRYIEPHTQGCRRAFSKTRETRRKKGNPLLSSLILLLFPSFDNLLILRRHTVVFALVPLPPSPRNEPLVLYPLGTITMSLIRASRAALQSVRGDIPPLQGTSLPPTHSIRDFLLRNGPATHNAILAELNRTRGEANEYTMNYVKRKVLWRMRDRGDVYVHKEWTLAEDGTKVGPKPKFLWALKPEAEARELKKREFPRRVPSQEKDE